MAWEDGQRGIYRMDSSQKTEVSKFHEIMNSSQPALVENLMGDTQQHYMDQILTSQPKVCNDPNMSRANQLLGINALMNDEDDDEPAPKVARLTLPGAPIADHETASQTGASTLESHEMPFEPAQSILQALRPVAPATASAKTAPKAKGKSKAKAEPKGKARAKSAASPPLSLLDQPQAGAVKSERPDEMPPPPAPPQKKPRVSPIEVIEPALTSNMAAHMMEGDSAWESEFKEKFLGSMCLAPREPESEFKGDLTERIRELNNTLTKIKARKRSVKRRAPQNQELAMKAADELEESLGYYLAFLKALHKGSGNTGFGDECLTQYKFLITQGAVFGVEIAKRITKALILDDIRFQRWPALISSTWEFVKKNISQDVAEPFFAQQVSVALQKLVKGIPQDKVGFV